MRKIFLGLVILSLALFLYFGANLKTGPEKPYELRNNSVNSTILESTTLVITKSTTIKAEVKSTTVAIESTTIPQELVKSAYPEVSACLNMSDEFLRWECTRSIAREKQDESICERIYQPLSRSDCFRDVTQEKNDASACEKIKESDQKDGCLVNIALKTTNSTVCEKVSSENVRYKCLAQTLASSVFCEKIGDVRTHDWCLYSLALKTKNASVCGNVNNVSLRDKCFLDYVKENRMDAIACNRITDDAVWSECDGIAVKLTCPVEHFMPKYGKPIEPRRKNS